MDAFDACTIHLGADLLLPDASARELGVAPATLAAWRSRGTGPTFVKLGAKLVRYRRADLSSFITLHRRGPAGALA
jgi:predicted DNA-binding transcriptional regulator AlpA